MSFIGEAQKRDYLEEHASRNGGNRYTEKTLKAFQAWLMKNQANQGRASDTIKEATTQAVEKEKKNWYSLEELSQITGYTPDYIRKEVFSSMGGIPQAHSKLGGYHNSQKFYDEYILKAIKAYQLL